MKLVNIHILLFLLFSFTAKAQVWTLQQCLDTAQAHNRSLQIVRNQMAIGAEKHHEAKANLIPKVTVNTDYKYFTDLPTQLMPLSTFQPTAPEGKFKEAQFGVPHNIGANVQLTMPLYNPQLLGAIEATKTAKELTALQYRKSEEQVLFDITNLYYNAQIIQYQLGFIDSNIVHTQRLLKNMQLLKTQQMAKGTDVNKVQLQVSQLQTQKDIIESKQQQVLNALKLAMGISLDYPLSIDTEIKQTELIDYQQNTAIEIQITQVQQRLTASELSTMQKSRLPTVGLVASYGTMGFGYDKSPNDFLKFFPLGFAGVQLSYPLFNGTVTQRKITQKKLELQNSLLQQSLATEQNKMQVANATLQRKVALQSMAHTKAQTAQANDIYQQTVLQQKQGLATLADVLQADTAMREAQQNELSAIVEHLKADIELKKYTGNISKQ